MNARIEKGRREGILNCPTIVLSDPRQESGIAEEVRNGLYRLPHI
jgi:hypothetical protein